ncbi:MAG: hypothetical protein ACTSVU_10250 [Promethearchaeota archaeon]
MSKSKIVLPSICNRPVAECEGCDLDEKLFCTFKFKDALKFGLTFWIFIAGMIWGIIRAHINGKFALWAELVIFAGDIIVVFGFLLIWENRILCSHCPYYGREEEKTLHCYANGGFRKLYKYHPEPMSKSEKIQFLFGVGMIIVYPLIFLAICGEFLFLGITFVGALIWFLVLFTQTCPRCPNFSCPLNRVPKETINAYLKKNDRMREAWLKAGWKMDE